MSDNVPQSEAVSLAAQDYKQTVEMLGNLPEQYAAALAFRKQQATFMAEISKTNWGMTVDVITRRAIASWGHDNDVDVATEIDILGGRIYVNSRYFYRKMATMIRDEQIEYVFADHVHTDGRLVELLAEGDEWAITEDARRRRLRIENNIPDRAAAAVIFRIKVKAMKREVTGVKWAGNGSKPKDPVGDAHPVESAESRAMRRAMLKLSETIRNSITAEVVHTMGTAKELAPMIESDHARQAENDKMIKRGISYLPPEDPEDPYDLKSRRNDATTDSDPNEINVDAVDGASA